MSRLLQVPVDRGEDHFLGHFGAAITLLEYGDYESPETAAVEPEIEQVRLGVDRELRFVFRHFPHDESPRAQMAAEAAEAAAAQGRFWEMHARLLADPGTLDEAGLLAHARELGLDMDRFESELRSGRHSERVLRDVESGRRSGVERAPAFFLDGERYRGEVEADTLIDELLDAAYE